MPEQNLYIRLVDALPEHVILALVAFSQMIRVVGGDGAAGEGGDSEGGPGLLGFLIARKADIVQRP